MEITTSQSKAQETINKPEPEPTSQQPSPDQDKDRYTDRSDDLVARVRRAREVAQRKMDEFGDISEYDVRTIHGRKREPQE